jgi:glycosyltransferase involved in cell wall biosynthesis
MRLIAPGIKATNKISIVIPVKDNQRGIDRFFASFFKTQESDSLPLEILIVCDQGSSVHLHRNWLTQAIDIRVLASDNIGPAAARNVGWRSAKGEWILFTDSDCMPAPKWLKGYVEASNGSVGYAATVLSYGRDFISRYYENQGILTPSMNDDTGAPSPEYLVTANALVWKKALEKIEGFNEMIKIAAGEDIDLSFRLLEIGDLSFAAKSSVFHNFDDGLVGFVKRFRRYGRANRLLGEMYSLNMKPKGFKPQKRSLSNSILAYLQYLSMFWGYHSINPKQSARVMTKEFFFSP